MLKEIILFLPLIRAIIMAKNSIYSVKQKTSIDGSSAVLGTISARSVTECSLRCMRRINCAAAEYQATNMRCQVHGDSPQYGRSTTDNIETKAITLVGSCPLTHAENSAQGSYSLKHSLYYF